MLSILIDIGLERGVSAPLLIAFERLQIAAAMWERDRALPIGTTNAVIIDVDHAEAISTRLGPATQRPVVIVFAASPSPGETRRLLTIGVVGVVNVSGLTPDVQALVALGAATGGCEPLPPQHGGVLSKRLEEPPRPLTDAEERILGAAATRSIEAAGRVLGLSRRQAQRRFKKLCEDLNLDSRRHAVVAAARWGIVDTSGDCPSGGGDLA